MSSKWPFEWAKLRSTKAIPGFEAAEISLFRPGWKQRTACWLLRCRLEMALSRKTSDVRTPNLWQFYVDEQTGWGENRV